MLSSYTGKKKKKGNNNNNERIMRAYCVKMFGFEFKISHVYLDITLEVTKQSTLNISGKNSVQIGRSL